MVHGMWKFFEPGMEPMLQQGPEPQQWHQILNLLHHLGTPVILPFFFFYGHTHSIWKFPGQGSNLHLLSNPSCYGQILTHWVTLGTPSHFEFYKLNIARTYFHVCTHAYITVSRISLLPTSVINFAIHICFSSFLLLYSELNSLTDKIVPKVSLL